MPSNNAVGLLHAEMRALGSLIMAAADAHRVPAGSALAVDRDGFSAAVTARLAAHPNVEIVRERIDALPASGLTIVATGPLTAARLAGSIGAATGADALAFFDAIAPIVHRDVDRHGRLLDGAAAGTRATPRITSTAR